MPQRILFVDDDTPTQEFVVAALKPFDFQVVSKGSGLEGMEALSSQEFDAIVTDLQMIGMDGLEFCRAATASRPGVPVIVLTGFGSMKAAVAAIRAGAYDFIAKPIQVDELMLTLARAIQLRQLDQEVKRLRSAVNALKPPDHMIGESPPMKAIYALLEQVQDSDATVLIVGESGTGKELVARALHERGRRSQGPFVPVNCAAIPEPMLESELFGHARGAFTDAKASRAGLFAQADKGTIFLDEIGEMPLSTQVKLLRALQERKARPVGGETEIAFDVRIVCATNRDLEAEVAAGRFREDLYYRINVIRADVPSLKARGNDILLLAQHFVEHFARQSKKSVIGLARSAAEKLLAYSWAGNVRELQNCIERAVILTTFDQITIDDLPEKIRDYSASSFVLPAENPTELVSMAEVEKRYVMQVMNAVGGRESAAAQILGFSRASLNRKLKSYGVS